MAIEAYLSPGRYFDLKLDSQGEYAAFSFGIIDRMGRAVGQGPTAVSVYPATGAIAVTALFDNAGAAARLTDTIRQGKLTFTYNNIGFNASLVPPGVYISAAQAAAAAAHSGRMAGLRAPPSALYPSPPPPPSPPPRPPPPSSNAVYVQTAVLNAAMGKLVADGDSYAALATYLLNSARGLLGPSGMWLHSASAIPSPTFLDSTDVSFVFSQAEASQAFREMLATETVRLSWNGILYRLALAQPTPSALRVVKK